jgi:hypothetical protein
MGENGLFREPEYNTDARGRSSQLSEKDAEVAGLNKRITMLKIELVGARRRLQKLAGDDSASKKPVEEIGVPETDQTKIVECREVKAPKSSVFAHYSAAVLPRGKLKRGLLLSGEAVVHVSLSLILARTLGIDESGVFSILLSAAVLNARMLQLLDENRKRIWEIGFKSWKANSITAYSILSIFIGAIVAYVAAAFWVGRQEIVHGFRFALRAAGLGGDSIVNRKFGGFGAVMGHNATVMMTIAGLSYVYRSYGVLLAIIWNACIWGLVLTLLVGRGLLVSEGSVASFLVISIVAIFPHLLLEATAYVVAAMASVFLSKGVSNYAPSTPEFWAVGSAGLKLLAIAVAFLLLGAVMETQYVPWLLAKL